MAEGGAVPRRTATLGQGAGDAGAAPPAPSGILRTTYQERFMELCDDVWHVVNDYCGFLAVKRGVEYCFPFQGRKGFRYETSVQVEAFQCVTYILEQFEHLLKAPYQKRKTMIGNADFCLSSIMRLVEILNYEGRKQIRGLDTTALDVALYFSDPANDSRLRRGAEQLCYMHQSVGYSTIDAIGTTPVTTAKKK